MAAVSGTAIKDDQRAYIKIETLRGENSNRESQFADGSVWCGNG